MPLLALLRRHLQQQLLPLLSLQYVHLTSHAKRCDLLLLSPAHTHIRSSYFRPIPNTGTNVWCASFTRGVSVALRDAHPCRSSACICTQPCLCMSFSRLGSEPPAVIFLRFGLANSSQILPLSLYIKDVCEIIALSAAPSYVFDTVVFWQGPRAAGGPPAFFAQPRPPVVPPLQASYLSVGTVRTPGPVPPLSSLPTPATMPRSVGTPGSPYGLVRRRQGLHTSGVYSQYSYWADICTWLALACMIMIYLCLHT